MKKKLLITSSLDFVKVANSIEMAFQCLMHDDVVSRHPIAQTFYGTQDIRTALSPYVIRKIKTTRVICNVALNRVCGRK